MKKLEMEINYHRSFVFPCNRKSYDITCESFVSEMQRRKDDRATLKKKLNYLIEQYKKRDLSMVPAQLCRKPNENPDEYLSRAYNTSGYRVVMPPLIPAGNPL